MRIAQVSPLYERVPPRRYGGTERVVAHLCDELVRRGPYALVRHPVYTGLALHFAGVCLATGNALLIAGTLLVSYPALYLRARAEEALLREKFGAEYEKYAREVPMLVPLP